MQGGGLRTLTWGNDGVCGIGTKLLPLQITVLVLRMCTPVHNIAYRVSRYGLPRNIECILYTFNCFFLDLFCAETNRTILLIQFIVYSFMSSKEGKKPTLVMFIYDFALKCLSRASVPKALVLRLSHSLEAGQPFRCWHWKSEVRFLGMLWKKRLGPWCFPLFASQAPWSK